MPVRRKTILREARAAVRRDLVPDDELVASVLATARRQPFLIGFLGSELSFGLGCLTSSGPDRNLKLVVHRRSRDDLAEVLAAIREGSAAMGVVSGADS